MTSSINSRDRRAFLFGLSVTAALALGVIETRAKAAMSGSEIMAGAKATLDKIYAARPDLAALGARAAGVLATPGILEAGVLLRGAYGEGVLLVDGEAESFWSYGATTVGARGRAKPSRMALFFKTEAALDAFRQRGRVALDSAFELGIVAVTVARDGALVDGAPLGGRYSRINP